MKIGQAGAASGCHLETIRYYERIGLLPRPPRTAGGYRDYRHEDVERLQFVTRGRDMGFSLEQIRSLIGLAENADLSCGEVDRVARQHLGQIEAKLDQLHRMASELHRVIESCSGGERARCTILDSLRQPPTED